MLLLALNYHEICPPFDVPTKFNGGQNADKHHAKNHITAAFRATLQHGRMGSPRRMGSSFSELKNAAIELGKQFGVKEVVIFGGRRTTGASVGKAAKNPKGQIKQKPLVFKVK